MSDNNTNKHKVEEELRKNKKTKSVITNILLTITSCIVGFLAIELISGVALSVMGNSKEATQPPPKVIETPALTHQEFRLSRPKPYAFSNYYDWFIKEEWTNQHPECHSKITHDGKGRYLRQSSTPYCRGHTVIDGWRITTDAPFKPRRSLYIFGGSSVHSHEVPNEYTIASYLQRMLNKHFPNEGIKVYNRGFTTVVTSQQNYTLEKTNLNAGDIVIYYDGGNDMWQGVGNNSPNGTIIGSNRNWRAKVIRSLKRKIWRLKFYRLVFFLKNRNQTSRNGTKVFEAGDKCMGMTLPSDVELLQRSRKSFATYKSNLIYASQVVRKKGATFLHFYQPTIFSPAQDKNTLYERELIAKEGSAMIPCGSPTYFHFAISEYKSRHNELVSSGVLSTDLSNAFWGIDRGNNVEYFLDWLHVAEAGNEIIAELIFKKLSDKIREGREGDDLAPKT